MFGIGAVTAFEIHLRFLWYYAIINFLSKRRIITVKRHKVGRGVIVLRMRKKPNLIPRMERCASLLEQQPQSLRGKWLETYPGYRQLRLELGCGKGRFTADMAAQNPDVLFVALERVPDAMVVAMERVLERQLSNVRFLDLDAVHVAEVFAPGEVSRIYINFPDPWRKTKQYKRRLTAPSFLRLYAEVLTTEGEVELKTDNQPLFEWSLEQFEQEKWSLSALSRDRHANGPVGVLTDYEAKFCQQGIPINHCAAVRPGV